MCAGLSADVDFMFRSENDVAQRNSERARKVQKSICAYSIPFDEAPVLATKEIEGAPRQTDIDNSGLQYQYPWLNDHTLATIPKSMTIDLDTRAVDRYFIDWTLYPRNDSLLSRVHAHHSSPLPQRSPGICALVCRSCHGICRYKASLCLWNPIPHQGKTLLRKGVDLHKTECG